MNSETHSCTVSFASFAILALEGKAFFIIRLMLAMGRYLSCSRNRPGPDSEFGEEGVSRREWSSDIWNVCVCWQTLILVLSFVCRKQVPGRIFPDTLLFLLDFGFPQAEFCYLVCAHGFSWTPKSPQKAGRQICH